MPKCFFDSSVLVEYFKGSQRAAKLIDEGDGVITLLNLLEVTYIISRDFSPEHGKAATKLLYEFLAMPTRNDVEDAVEVRLQNRKLDLSYADALGYAYAKRRNILFLTSDRAFKGMPNVELVDFAG